MKRLLVFLLCAAMALSCQAYAVSETVTDGAPAAAQDVQTVRGIGDVKQIDAQPASVTLAWSKAEGADKYAVYMLNGKTEKYVRRATTDGVEATIDGLKAGKSYTFKIRGIDTHSADAPVMGKPSAEFVAVTSPAAVKAVTCDSVGRDSVRVIWPSVDGATGYRVFIYSREKEKFVYCGAAHNCRLTVPNLEENRLYTFKVQAVRRDSDFAAAGQMSAPFSEFTDKEGVPVTNAQAAVRYNEAVNSAKKQKALDVTYTRQITTGFVSCTKEQLVNTVNNQLSLLDGKISNTYKFVGGKSGSVSVNSLFEPYSAQACVRGSDIKKFSSKTQNGIFTLSLTLKRESAAYKNKTTALPSKNKHALSTVKLENIVTKPVRLKSAVQTYKGTVLTLKTKDGALSSLSIKCPVEVSANCRVSTLSFSTVVKYELTEKYSAG